MAVHLRSSPEFLIRRVQVALRLQNARVAEHQLDDPDVDATRQETARAFVSEVMPAEIDPLKLLTIPRGTPSNRKGAIGAEQCSRNCRNVGWTESINFDHVGSGGPAARCVINPRQRRTSGGYSGEIASTYPPLFRKTNVSSTESGLVIRLHALNASTEFVSILRNEGDRRDCLLDGFGPDATVCHAIHGMRRSNSRKLKRGDRHCVRQAPEVESLGQRSVCRYALSSIFRFLRFAIEPGRRFSG